jgi:sulfonate transport system substrate-binding protein
MADRGIFFSVQLRHGIFWRHHLSTRDRAKTAVGRSRRYAPMAALIRNARSVQINIRRLPRFPKGGDMRILRFVLLGVFAVLAPCSGATAEPVRIRLAWIAPATNWGSILLEKKELARHLGQSYVLEPIHFVGTPQMVTALASGELDIADLAFSTLPIAIQNAGMDDLRVIADELQDGVPGYYSQEYMVLADGPIKTIEDLKGKVVATVAAGAAVDIAIRAMLRNHGLENKRDYTMVEAPLATMRAMLADGKVELIPEVLPFALDPELRKIARPLFYNRDVAGVTQLLMWTAHKRFIDDNRAALVDFMEDTLRITHWYLDPANHKEVTEIVGRVAKQPPERFDWLFTTRDYHHDPNMLPDVAALQRNVDLVKDLGFVKDGVDVSRHTDLSLIADALARLK